MDAAIEQEIETCKFIRSSFFLNEFPGVNEAFSNACEISYGDANRSMVDKDCFCDILEEACSVEGFFIESEENDEETYGETTELAKNLRKVWERVRNLPDDIYIDLEN